MQNAGNGGHRRDADTGHSATQAFYADGHKMSSHVIRAALHHLGVAVTHFDDTKGCLDSLTDRECHLLISNVQRPGVEGLQLLRRARHIRPSMPVVMLVDHGDIQTAVCAMKGGAADCLERPPEIKHVVSAIDSVLQESAHHCLPPEDALTRTERQVLRLVLQGQTTAGIARTLHRSRRTIEVHRSHIMRKLQADGIVDLVKRSAQVGLLQDWP